MAHKPIYFTNLSFSLPHKTCFQNVDIRIGYRERIAIVGKNGAGKSTLLRLIRENLPSDVVVGYVPQITDDEARSGAEQFHHQLSQALAIGPNLLLLDEPTNHLDRDNRLQLMRMLDNFPHTVVIATHDYDLLTNHCNTFFYIGDGDFSIFTGHYLDFEKGRAQKEREIEHELSLIGKQQQKAHSALMHEQARSKASRLMGEKSIRQRKWPTIVSNAKARRAEKTSGKKQLALREERQGLVDRLQELRRPEVLTPKFHFASQEKTGVLVSLREASFGYATTLVSNINLDIRFGERIAIIGKNASGKSSLLKALLDVQGIARHGRWHAPTSAEIGYLDQHYRNLDSTKTVFASVSEMRPAWSVAEIRHHLNSFLFRKNEEVTAQISTLSGGERARLSLCLIAASSPQLLLLDEITNNIDRETRDHVTTALNAYRGSLVIVSHDEEFLKNIRITTTIAIVGTSLRTVY